MNHKIFSYHGERFPLDVIGLSRFIKNIQLSGFIIGRHRYLVVIWIFLLGISIWFVIMRLRAIGKTNQIMNIVSISLLIYPTIHLVSFAIRTQSGLKKLEVRPFTEQRLEIPSNHNLPDIYYIQLLYYLFASALFMLGFSWITSALIVFIKDVGEIVAVII